MVYLEEKDVVVSRFVLDLQIITDYSRTFF